jgi:hypothetical protein
MRIWDVYLISIPIRQESKRTGEGQGNENALMLAILVTKSRLAVPLADDEC